MDHAERALISLSLRIHSEFLQFIHYIGVFLMPHPLFPETKYGIFPVQGVWARVDTIGMILPV